MAGTKGHSGAKPLNVVEHQWRGTYRGDRHGAALARLEATPPSHDVSVGDRRRLLAGLGKAGKRFIQQQLAECEDWAASDFIVVRHIGHTTDRVQVLQNAIEAAGGAVQPGRRGAQREHPLSGALRRETKLLLSLLQELGRRKVNT